MFLSRLLLAGVFLALSVFFPGPIFAETAAIELEWSNINNPVRIGDSLTVKAKQPQELLLDLSSVEEELSQQGWNIESTDGHIPFKAYPLKSGRIILPSIPLKDASGNIVTKTQPLAVDVQSAIAPEDPRPKEPEAAVPPVRMDFPVWVAVSSSLGVVFLLGGILYLLYFLWKKNKPAAVEISLPPLSEDEKAFAALKELEMSPWLEQRNFKRFYFKLSEILKEYIGTRYHFTAPECTTEEMLNFLKEKRGDEFSEIKILKGIFELLDLVKFTDHVPEKIEGSELVEKSRIFIRKTRRTVVAPIVPAEVSTDASG